MFMRLYGKIWDKRLRKKILFDERQKGFVSVDGCFGNVQTLQQMIKSQRQRKKEYNIVFIDLAKAFDTISQKSITIGLSAQTVPRLLAVIRFHATRLETRTNESNISASLV